MKRQLVFAAVVLGVAALHVEAASAPDIGEGPRLVVIAVSPGSMSSVIPALLGSSGEVVARECSSFGGTGDCRVCAGEGDQSRIGGPETGICPTCMGAGVCQTCKDT